MQEPVKLYAPDYYWDLPEEDLKSITNGCGSGKLQGLLVPDTNWGLWIGDCCDIHDVMYYFEMTLAGKRLSDRVLLNNIVRKVEALTKTTLLKRLRLRRAETVFWFVDTFGGPYFWKNKNVKVPLGIPRTFRK